MFELVMFDLDGTLVDTAGDICDTANETLEAYGLPAADESLARRWIGHGSRELMVQAWAFATGMSRDAVRSDVDLDGVMERFARVHDRRCGDRSTVFPRVTETLASLRGEGRHLAIVTNRELHLAERVLEIHGLRGWFETVVGGDSLPKRKPDPLPVHFCLGRHQVSADRALFVGDSAVDVATARNAGVTCWAVPYGYNGGVSIRDSGPDRVIDDVSALLGLDNGPSLAQEKAEQTPPVNVPIA